MSKKTKHSKYSKTRNHKNTHSQSEPPDMVEHNNTIEEKDSVDIDVNSKDNQDAEESKENMLNTQESENALDKLSTNEDASKTDTVIDNASESENVKKDGLIEHKFIEENVVTQIEAPKKGNILSSLVAFLALILGVGLCVLAYFGYEEFNQYKQEVNTSFTSVNSSETEKKSIAKLKITIEEQDKKLAVLKQQLQNNQNSIKSTLAKSEARLSSAEKRLIAQNKRLLSMSTISREDWMLAEAEYLLKLANQRILVERDASNAEALLVEVDHIIRDIDDPDLYSLREQLAKDISKLRLTVNIDMQGLYLALNALADQVEAIPFEQTREDRLAQIDESFSQIAQSNVEEGEKKNNIDMENLNLNEVSPWRRPFISVKNSVTHMLQNMDQYIQIRDRKDKPIVLLSPQNEVYIRQNLRLMIEKAQMALMRQDQSVYLDSISKAQSWIESYFPPSKMTQVYATQLEVLAGESIVPILPDITASLELLKSHIDKMHRLEGSGNFNAQKNVNTLNKNNSKNSQQQSKKKSENKPLEINSNNAIQSNK